MKPLTLILAVILAFGVVHSSAFAAEVKSVKNHSMGCEYKLSGLINDGDAEKVNKILSENNSFQAAVRGWKICLNSPGGSFVEGVKLAKVFAQNSIGTVVAQNAVCESACAIAFLGGRYAHPEGETSRASRTIHPTAKLGFHAPALQIPDGNYSKKEVDQAYGIALKAVVELSNLRAEGYEIRESLFKSILTTPFEKMHYVDTIEKALRYKIGVDSVKISPAAVKSISKNICNNAVLAIEDSLPWFGGGEELKFVSGNTLYQKQGYYEEASYDCSINLSSLTTQKIFSVSFGVGPNDRGRGHIVLPVYASFRSDTPLASVYIEKNRKLDEFLTEAAKLAGNTLRSCSVQNTRSSIINVQNFTNLRRQAGLNGQIIGQVPLGATVSVVNPGRYFRTDRCAAACQGNNQNAIKQCINNNDVWIEVQYNGRRGFLSRQFLE